MCMCMNANCILHPLNQIWNGTCKRNVLRCSRIVSAYHSKYCPLPNTIEFLSLLIWLWSSLRWVLSVLNNVVFCDFCFPSYNRCEFAVYALSWCMGVWVFVCMCVCMFVRVTPSIWQTYDQEWVESYKISVFVIHIHNHAAQNHAVWSKNIRTHTYTHTVSDSQLSQMPEIVIREQNNVFQLGNVNDVSELFSCWYCVIFFVRLIFVLGYMRCMCLVRWVDSQVLCSPNNCVPRVTHIQK